MQNRGFIIIAVNNYSSDKQQRWHLLMAQPSLETVHFQQLADWEERVESLDLRQIRTLSGMSAKLLYSTQGYESY